MQWIKFRGYRLFHHHREAAESMIRQIDDFPSFFTPTGERPLIIDCGANIGVSVLEWKIRWPQAHILCFEPDPYAFEMLQRNMEANDIPGVECVNAAVLDREGTVPFYGQLAPAADSRGNSVVAEWATRAGSTQTTVRCTRLSPYLKGREISFLKLDIEGAEPRVLAEIAGCLDRVSAMYVEVHETRETAEANSAAALEQGLRGAGFTTESEPRYGEHALPRQLDSWRQRHRATLTQLLCWRPPT